MTTIELEVVADEEEEETHDPCHLYWVGHTIAICGVAGVTDWHFRAPPHATVRWSKGMLSCLGCGTPICMDCILQMS